jgi:peptidoglycan/LPS O-acetylase OafA/YrhL
MTSPPPTESQSRSAARRWRPRASLGLDHLVREGRSENNFDMLRLVAALIVLFGHSFDLTARLEPLAQINEIGWGSVGVLIFFSISGFLVARSWDYAPRLGAFTLKRALRLLPALIVVLVLSAVILGPLASSLSPGAYFSDPATKSYVLDNALLQTNYVLPGVFVHTIYPNAVNGSLYTLPVEVKAYLLLAIFGCIGALVRVRWVMLVFSAYVLLAMFPAIRNGLPLGDHYAAYLLNIQMPAATVAQVQADPSAFTPYVYFLAAFGIGTALYTLRRFVFVWWPLAATCLAAIVIAVAVAGRFSIAPSEVMVIVLPYLVMCVAYRTHSFLRLPRWWGDYSYGIYIYAFPVQQTISTVFNLHSGWLMFVIATPVTLVLAALSWHLVEKRALRWKSAVGGSTAEASAPVAA